MAEVGAREGWVCQPGPAFAATFFLFFSFSVDPSDLVGVLAPAALLAAFGIAGKLVSGWVAARPLAAGVPGRLRAGTVLIARGEFSIVIATLGAATADGAELGAMTAAYVLLTAMAGPAAAKYADRLGAAVSYRVSPDRGHSSR